VNLKAHSISDNGGSNDCNNNDSRNERLNGKYVCSDSIDSEKKSQQKKTTSKQLGVAVQDLWKAIWCFFLSG
jgi:hypothetical protein